LLHWGHSHFLSLSLRAPFWVRGNPNPANHVGLASRLSKMSFPFPFMSFPRKRESHSSPSVIPIKMGIHPFTKLSSNTYFKSVNRSIGQLDKLFFQKRRTL